ncbi:hypothetical protein ACJPQX_20640 [Vibrio vulnificus]|uniref:hypothetical protein n=1 Tax=Vibrio vulnificus TaxID=672 RepID=UPI003D9CB278
MAIGHKINEEELVNLFDQFVGEVVHGELDEEVTEFLHETVREMASGHPIYVSKGDFTNLLNDFISMFYFDDEKGGYHFEFEGIVAQGPTTLINIDA